MQHETTRPSLVRLHGLRFDARKSGSQTAIGLRRDRLELSVFADNSQGGPWCHRTALRPGDSSYTMTLHGRNSRSATTGMPSALARSSRSPRANLLLLRGPRLERDSRLAAWLLLLGFFVKEGAVMRFKNREEAAGLLADRLAPYRGQRPVVLGVPRGAVPMARVIADALGGDLEVVLVRKLRAPAQPELAMGAVDETGAILKGRYFDVATEDYLGEEVRTQLGILRMRREQYTRAQAPVDPAGRIAIIVDDGVATGSSMLSAIRSVRGRKPKKVIVAIGVAPPSSLARIEAEADEVICLYTSEDFFAVGQFFDDFSEVTDDMVVAALAGPQMAAAHQGE
jgi:predicted phosphoribosyltransferase